MSKAIKLFINQIKSPEYKEYFLSTHFWAPALTFALPLGTFQQIFTGRVEDVDPRMTLALAGYSLCFMHFAIKVRPRNNLLLVCHAANEFAQVMQGCRLLRQSYDIRRAEARNLATIPAIGVTTSAKSYKGDK